MKKILIFSEHNDQSTSEVMDWIRHLGGTAFRVNGPGDFLGKNFFWHLNGTQPQIGLENASGENLFGSECHAVWFRRGLVFPTKKSTPVDDQRAADTPVLLRALWQALAGKRWLGHPEKMRADKLQTLVWAQACGLNVPHTWVANQRSVIQTAFEDSQNNLIVKPLSEPLQIQDAQRGTWLQYTERVTQAWLDTLPDTFWPLLVQNEVPKQVDVRVFFLDGRDYGMAAWPDTTAPAASPPDGRFYRNGRRVPHNLPADVADKLRALFDKMELNCGSADFILSPDGLYTFLEINPVGQFGMVSKTCGYPLEKHIAEWLLRDH